jgi:hypothetical protein
LRAQVSGLAGATALHAVGVMTASRAGHRIGLTLDAIGLHPVDFCGRQDIS